MYEYKLKLVFWKMRADCNWLLVESLESEEPEQRALAALPCTEYLVGLECSWREVHQVLRDVRRGTGALAVQLERDARAVARHARRAAPAPAGARVRGGAASRAAWHWLRVVQTNRWQSRTSVTQRNRRYRDTVAITSTHQRR